ncbi:MAG: hypothetical protein ACI81I_000619, partial [Arcobacteraceae bacterium]
TFVDSPVEGLKYSTSTLSGFTDNQGRFQYKDGELVTFKIGNLELGSAAGGELMTPLTLTGESDLNNISSKATNIARILQSLDENSSNSGLIKISSSLKDLNVSNIDLEADADLGTILSEAQRITSKTYVLKDSASAKADMKKYIGLYNQYTLLKSNSLFENGTNMYLLRVPNSSKISFAFNYMGSKVSIYDIDLNLIMDSYSGGFIADLEQGTYLVQLKIQDKQWSSGDYVDGYMTIYSPILNDYQSLSTLEVKSYNNYDSAQYYKLSLEDSTHINFSLNYMGSRYAIYDKSLNLITKGDNDGTRNLEKGDYIVLLKIQDKLWSGGNYTKGFINITY